MSARCDELGPAGLLLRTAAVIGQELDPSCRAVSAIPSMRCSTRPSGPWPSSSWSKTGGSSGSVTSWSGGPGGERDRGAGRVAAPAGRPRARPASGRRPADRGQPRAPGRRPHAAARALRTRRPRRRALRPAAAEALLDVALILSPDPEGWLARARVRNCAGGTPRP